MTTHGKAPHRHRLAGGHVGRSLFRGVLVFLALGLLAYLVLPAPEIAPVGPQAARVLSAADAAAVASGATTAAGGTASAAAPTDGVDDKGQPIGAGSGASSSGTGATEPGTGEAAVGEPVVTGATNVPGGTMIAPQPRVAPDGSCVDTDAEIIAQDKDTVTVKEPVHACGEPYFATASAIGARDGSGQLFRSPTGFGYEPMPEPPDTENDLAGRASATANPAASATGAACSTVLDSVAVADTVAEAGNKIIASTGYSGEVLGKGSRTTPGSDHPDGYAIDFLVGKNNIAEGNKIRDYVMGHLNELNGLYVIWQQTYYNHRGSSHMENRGTDTANHLDHVHVSFKRTPAPAPITC